MSRPPRDEPRHYPPPPADPRDHPEAALGGAVLDERPEDRWSQFDDEPDGRGSATTFRRRRGGSGRLGKVIVIGVVVLLLGGLGFVGYRYVQGDGFGGTGEAYFPDLTVSKLISTVENKGFDCTPGRTIAQCDKSIEGADLGITVHFAGESEVKEIEASGGTAAYTDDAASPDELRGFFSMAAGLPWPAGSGSASAAEAWAADTVEKAGSRTFDGVYYRSSADQPLLVMTPA